MLRLEWMLNTLGGPFVGERAVHDVDHAAEVILFVMREVAGPDVDQAAHVESRALVAALIRGTAPTALDDVGHWSYRVPAVSLTITQEPG